VNLDESLPPTVSRPTCRVRIAGTTQVVLVVEGTRSVTIGRDEQCQLRIEQDPAVSRFHCRLEVNPPHFRLLDLGGLNGTYLNDERIQDSPLSDGDVFRCGQTRLQIEILIPPDNDRDQTIITSRVEETDEEGWPQSLGGFKLKQEIGRGAMGRVFLALHPSTRKKVAIKVILPEVASDPTRLGLFMREASVLSRLKHPRIVEVRDFGIQDHWPYLVMEYIPVIKLDEFLKEYAPPDRIRVACRIVILVLEALEHAHSNGFVHRDVKPTNLLAYRDAAQGKLHVKLGDFGLAKSFENAGLSGITGSREVRGTIVYMSPEQLLDSRSAGPASDIYSAGATLYRLITGSAPYDAPTFADALSAVMNRDPHPIQKRLQQIPSELAAVVHRALHREPAQRFASAADMREALQVFGRRK
jgi:serine/threonine protein kinase